MNCIIHVRAVCVCVCLFAPGTFLYLPKWRVLSTASQTKRRKNMFNQLMKCEHLPVRALLSPCSSSSFCVPAIYVSVYLVWAFLRLPHMRSRCSFVMNHDNIIIAERKSDWWSAQNTHTFRFFWKITNRRMRVRFMKRQHKQECTTKIHGRTEMM